MFVRDCEVHGNTYSCVSMSADSVPERVVFGSVHMFTSVVNVVIKRPRSGHGNRTAAAETVKIR